MTIGCQGGDDVALDNTRVSRRHALLYRTQDGSYDLADEDSANGSFVNAEHAAGSGTGRQRAGKTRPVDVWGIGLGAAEAVLKSQ